jgi:uncharacterized membrane protein
MEVMIILNIILIIALIFLVLYLFNNKKDSTKSICVNDEKCECVESSEHKKKNNINSERVFVGRFVTDEEYQQMMKNRKSDIAILLEEVNNEYEHLKELSK